MERGYNSATYSPRSHPTRFTQVEVTLSLTEFRGVCEFRRSPVRTGSGERGNVRRSNV